jgi:hypothetical protein
LNEGTLRRVEKGDGDLVTLCKSCGLCCDGSLFGRVPLEPDEIDAARTNRLPIVGDAQAFEQPCTAYVQNACICYDERPRACHRFICRLYARHEREGGPLAPRLEAVRRTRELLDFVRAVGPEKARSTPAFEELVQRLEVDFARE